MEDDSLIQLLDDHHHRGPLVFFSILSAIALIGSGAYLFFSSPSKAKPSTSETQRSTLPAFTPTQTIVVDIEGAVAHPGLIKIILPIDASIRIGDVIASSGGLLADADKEYVAMSINQAQEVKDGTKLYIPKKGELVRGTGSVAGAQTVNVNSGSVESLEKLSGIGSGRAQTIIKSRPYTDAKDLQQKTKIPLSIIEKIRDEISF